MEPEEFDMLSALCSKLGAASNCKRYPELHVDARTYDYVRMRMTEINQFWKDDPTEMPNLMWNGTKLVRSL